MTKNTIIGISIGATVLVIGLGGGAWWLWHKHQLSVALASGTQLAAGVSGAVTNMQASSGAAIPLSGSSTSTSQDSSGLSVSNGASSSLAQLDANSTYNVNGGSSASSGSGSSSSASAPDPSTFGQYDQYKNSSSAMFGDMVKGTGATLGANQKATVYYKGWLTNGTLFDQSQTGSDGKLVPFHFTEGAGQVIKGWEQGLAGMQVGGVRLVIVPPEFGYGATGQGAIPGNAVLVFEVQLVAVD